MRRRRGWELSPGEEAWGQNWVDGRKQHQGKGEDRRAGCSTGQEKKSGNREGLGAGGLEGRRWTSIPPWPGPAKTRGPYQSRQCQTKASRCWRREISMGD